MGWRRSSAIAICSMVRRGSRAVAWTIALGWVALLAGCDTSLPEVALVARRASAPAAGNVSELTAWYPIVLHSQWPGELLLSAVQRSDGQPISLTATGYDIIETDFRDHLLAAAATGNAPDVVYLTDTGYLPMLVAAGVLEPLTACRAAQPALARIAANAWPDVTGRGEIWGVPVAQELSVLFFSKPKLRALGWSEAEIDQLPTRIATGDFTLLDLRDTAAAAIDAGVVQPGFGFSQRPSGSTKIIEHYVAFGGRIRDTAQDRLVITEAALAATYAFRRELVDAELISPYLLQGSANSWSSRLVWNDAMGHGRALFWHSQSIDWQKWLLVADSSAERGVNPALSLSADDVGVAGLPSAVAGLPGTLRSRFAYFVVLNEAATGRRLQGQACALLAQATTPQLHNAMAGSGLLSALAVSPSPALLAGYPAGIELLREHQQVWPSYIDHDVLEYERILAEFALEVHQGRLTPTAAATAAARRLRLTLGDDLIME